MNATESLSPKVVGDSVTNDPPLSAPRIEVKTLVQDMSINYNVLRADEEFADALNAGWELLNIGFTTHNVDIMGGLASIPRRIVTLHRLVEAAPKPAEAVVEAAPPEYVTVLVEGLGESYAGLIPADELPARAPAILNSAPLLELYPAPVTYAEAFARGSYSLEHLRWLAEREAQQAGLDGAASWQPQVNRLTGAAWEGLVFQRAPVALLDGG